MVEITEVTDDTGTAIRALCSNNVMTNLSGTGSILRVHLNTSQ